MMLNRLVTVRVDTRDPQRQIVIELTYPKQSDRTDRVVLSITQNEAGALEKILTLFRYNKSVTAITEDPNVYDECGIAREL
jgi:hypothetical protein